MSMIECKCPNCGATMKVDNNVEKATCEFCGATMVIAKPINVNGDYIRNQTNNTQITKQPMDTTWLLIVAVLIFIFVSSRFL